MTMRELKCPGIGRVHDNKKVLDLHFNREPTDGEMRFIHDKIITALILYAADKKLNS